MRVGGVGVARPQKRPDEVPALAIEDEQRMVHVLALIAVIVRTFLFSVSRIVGCVEVQKHLIWSAVLLPLREVELKEDFGDLAARAPRGRILHPRDGRLARKSGAALGKCAAGELQ